MLPDDNNKIKLETNNKIKISKNLDLNNILNNPWVKELLREIYGKNCI
jgi:hypothetical protein